LSYKKVINEDIVPTITMRKYISFEIIILSLKINNWSAKSKSVAAINVIYKDFAQVETYRDRLMIYRPIVINTEVPNSELIASLVTTSKKSNIKLSNTNNDVITGYICKKEIAFLILALFFIIYDHL
jgi:hypothetical protein